MISSDSLFLTWVHVELFSYYFVIDSLWITSLGLHSNQL